MAPINISIDELDMAVNQIIDGVDTKLDDYIATNAKMSDDELLIFEAIVARHIGLIVVFALTRARLGVGTSTESVGRRIVDRTEQTSRRHGGKTGSDIGDDVRYVLSDVDERLTNYIITMKLNEDEALLLEAMMNKRIDKMGAEALFNVHRIACGLAPIHIK